MFNSNDELLAYIKDEGVEMVDIRFCDLPGVMQHFTVPVSSFDESVFEDGLSFDGVCLRAYGPTIGASTSLSPVSFHL
mgnify:CR=1 FL=1